MVHSSLYTCLYVFHIETHQSSGSLHFFIGWENYFRYEFLCHGWEFNRASTLSQPFVHRLFGRRPLRPPSMFSFFFLLLYFFALLNCKHTHTSHTTNTQTHTGKKLCKSRKLKCIRLFYNIENVLCQWFTFFAITVSYALPPFGKIYNIL